MHITDPTNFPPAKTATYKLHSALLPEALENSSRLNIPNMVLVQPSTYGTDNSCLLDSLQKLGSSRARGVIVIDPEDTNIEKLKQWHDLGVRGVRVNLKSVGKYVERQELLEMLRRYVIFLRQMENWVLQLYIDMSVIAEIGEELVSELNGTKLVLDHFSTPSVITLPLSEIPGWNTVMRMMRNENVFVKASAPYRISKDREWKDLEEITKAFLAVRGGDRVVFASDWPHTRFEDTDIMPWLYWCLEWCGDDEVLRNKLFRDNAKVLWDVE